MYLTREQAVAQLMSDGRTAESAANATLDNALHPAFRWPRSLRTCSDLITAYPAGMCMGAWPDPDAFTKADLFTISRW